ncbi:MAG: universal stress protein [Bacteroidetes bacterium]|nr:universal stress protein [Bacteroidota bacterium]
MPNIKNKPARLRVLVPTDLSVASKSGIRFAIQWSRQQDIHLVFVLVISIQQAPAWSQDTFKKYVAHQQAKNFRQLKQFVKKIYERMGLPARNYSCTLIEGMSADIALQEYSRQDGHFDYICMSTRGAGKLKRFFGTHTGNLITHSSIPVLAIPAAYRYRPIRRLLYAGDMFDYQKEMKKVVDFARPFKAAIHLVHFLSEGATPLNPAVTEAVFREQFSYPVSIHFKWPDESLSFAHNLEKQIPLLHPSMVVLFTDIHRSFLQRLLDPSRAERLSFTLKQPLLVFPK